MIVSFTSPMPNQKVILGDYEAKKKPKITKKKENE